MTFADAAVPTGRYRGWTWLCLALAVVVADQVTKAAIVAAFGAGGGLAITDFFSLILTYNTGAAFSFLAAETGWQRWFFAAVALVATALIVVLLRRGGSGIYCAGLALILGGALGNLSDRLVIGKVVDFLLFHYQQWAFPAFNVADSAITVGAALLIVDSFRARRAALPKET
jgi:signal peptidase II